MNNQSPFGFVPEDNFNLLTDIKNLYSQIASIQLQLNSIERKIEKIESKDNYPAPKHSPIPISNNANYTTENYII